MPGVIAEAGIQPRVIPAQAGIQPVNNHCMDYLIKERISALLIFLL
jgi:hypothetical protein